MNGTGLEDAAGFAIVEHTADIGLRIWAPTLEGLFEQAALGMISLLTDPAEVRPERTEEISVDGADLEEALIAWLQEILYRFEVRRFVPARIEIREVNPRGVRARIDGESLDRTRHEVRLDIKAATYHDIAVRREQETDGSHRWSTTVIFDI